MERGGRASAVVTADSPRPPWRLMAAVALVIALDATEADDRD